MRYINIVSEENSKEIMLKKIIKISTIIRNPKLIKTLFLEKIKKIKVRPKCKIKIKMKLQMKKIARKKKHKFKMQIKKKETSTKTKNIKSGLTEKEAFTSKANEKSSLANVQKEKSGNA